MPNSKDLNGSLFDTVSTHTELLDDHGNLLKQHADEISLLKKSDEDIMRELKGMKMDFTNLENTIWKTAQSTQDMMTSQNAQQWKLIEALNNGNQEERVRRHELTKTKLEKFWEYAGKFTVLLLGSGGFLIMLLELLAK